MQYQKLPTNVSKQTIFSQKRGLIHRNKSTLFWWRENSAGLNKHEGFQSHLWGMGGMCSHFIHLGAGLWQSVTEAKWLMVWFELHPRCWKTHHIQWALHLLGLMLRVDLTGLLQKQLAWSSFIKATGVDYILFTPSDISKQRLSLQHSRLPGFRSILQHKSPLNLSI